jgi:hypothetical protein
VEETHGFGNFIIDFLRGERADSVGVSITKCGDLIFELIIFTTLLTGSKNYKNVKYL